MEQQVRYNSLDVMKMFMAFLVVGIHAGTMTNTHYPTALEILLSTAVPFFFICSGFFLQNKIIRTNKEELSIKTYFLKTLKLFLLWHLAWLPIDIWFLWKNGHTLIENICLFFRLLLLTGETIFSWPLWYLHGLLIAISIIFILRKFKLTLPTIWLISIIIMIWGHAGRNGFFQGFPYVATGMIIRQYLPHIPYSIKNHPIFPKLRLYSMLIYFIHMYFMLILFTLYKENVHPYQLWISVFLTSWIAAYLFDIIRFSPFFKWLNHLIA